MNKYLSLYEAKASMKEVSEIRDCVSCMKACVRKYAAGKENTGDRNEMLEALAEIEKTLKEIVKKGRKSGRMNESADEGPEFIYAVWCAYDGGERFNVLHWGTDLKTAENEYANQIDEFEDTMDDESVLSLVKLPNTIQAAKLLIMCSDERLDDILQNEAKLLDDMAIEYIDQMEG